MTSCRVGKDLIFIAPVKTILRWQTVQVIVVVVIVVVVIVVVVIVVVVIVVVVIAVIVIVVMVILLIVIIALGGGSLNSGWHDHGCLRNCCQYPPWMCTKLQDNKRSHLKRKYNR